MDHEQTMGMNSRASDQKQQNIFGRISLFWSVELQGHPEQLNEGDHDWLIETPVSTVQRGMLVQLDADTWMQMSADADVEPATDELHYQTLQLGVVADID